MGDDSTALTAAGIARRIRDGDRSPVDVVEAHLDRIRERNDRTNAFVTVTEDLALETAEAAEQAIEGGEPLGPLTASPSPSRTSTTSRASRRPPGRCSSRTASPTRTRRSSSA